MDFWRGEWNGQRASSLALCFGGVHGTGKRRTPHPRVDLNLALLLVERERISTRSGSDSRISMAANAVLHHRQFTDSAPAQTSEVSVAGLCNLPGLKEGRDRAARDGTSAARSPGAMPGLGLDLVSRRGLLDLEGGMPQRRRRARAPGVPGRLGRGANPRSDEATGW
jgi:hypothetical protein